MAQSLLQLDHISKQFGNKTVLDDISLSVKPGEIIALVGPSGSGKSTLMNAMMNAIPLNQGEIRLDNRPIKDYVNHKHFAQKIGMLHQHYDLVNELDVIHNVLAGRLNRLNHWGFWRSLFSLFKPQEKGLAEHALRAVGLAEKISENTTALSGGEQQRVAIARLLVQDPLLILADEPVSALDPVNAQNVLALLTDLVRNQGKTLIASLHAVEYAKHYFDRMIGMRSGKILFDLPTAAVSHAQLQALYEVAHAQT